MNTFTKIVYNCRKATFLIEKKQLTPLTTREKLELKIHLAGCGICRIFQKQSIFINEMVRNHFHAADTGEIFLDQEFKNKLQHQIEEGLNKN